MRLIQISCIILLLCRCSDHSEQSGIVFRYNQPNPITSLDPAFAKAQNNIWAVNHLFNTLVSLDDNLNVVPSLAKKWNIEENGKKLSFTLRDDVYFHDNECFESGVGRKVLAMDVEYSLQRLLSTGINSPGAWLFADKKGDLPLFEAYNDSIFVINLKEPFMPILGILSMQYCSIIPKEAVDYYGDEWRRNPVGTGPFQYKRWIEDQALFLIKNPNYFDSTFQSNIDFVKTVFITDKQIALYELLRGKLDLISGIESSYVGELLTKDGALKTDKEDLIQYKQTPYLNTEYLGINMELSATHPFLSQKKFRQALNYAVDKQLMLKSLRNNVGLPAEKGFIPAGLPPHNLLDAPGYPYNITKARQLIDETNYDGSRISIHTNNEYLDIVTFVAKQWEKIGVKTDIKVLESAVLRDGMRRSNLPVFRASWIADYPDAESFLCMFYSKNPAPPNYTRFYHPIFDELYENAIKESDLQTRLELYNKMDSIIIEEAPVVFLFYDASSVFYSKSINGYTNNGLNLLNVRFHMKE